jgi:hypothetical protein
MTLAMNCRIVFAKNDRRAEIILTQVTEIIIESSWKLLTDTAEIVIPRKVKFFDKNKVRDVFSRGDFVMIAFGYNGNNTHEFMGYITEVSTDIPIKIKLQDEMWKLKQMAVNYSSPKIYLQHLLQIIVKGQYRVDALENLDLGSVRFPKTTVAAVLEKLQGEPWKLNTYFKTINGKPVLVCGKYYADDSLAEKVGFHLERNCVSSSLNYKKKEDVRVIIKGVSTFPNGTKIEFEHGDKDGNQLQLTYYKVAKAQLEVAILKDYNNYKQDRFDGSFTSFGIPSVQHGQKAVLSSSLYEDRKGTYYIEGVTKTFNRGGIRQEIKLDKKAF